MKTTIAFITIHFLSYLLISVNCSGQLFISCNNTPSPPLPTDPSDCYASGGSGAYLVMNTWIGGTSGDWDDITNWSQGDIPTTDQHVEITSGVTVNITTSVVSGSLDIYAGNTLNIKPGGALTAEGMVTNDGDILIESDAAGISGSFIDYCGLSGNGHFRFDRFLTPGTPKTHFGWHYISSPVNNTVSGDFVGYWVKKWEESDTTFIDIDAYPGGCDYSFFNVAIVVGQGYSVKQDIDYLDNCTPHTGATGETVEFGGDYMGAFPGFNNGVPSPTDPAKMANVNTGNISTSISSGSSNWNLVGNPYPSGWDYDEFFFGPNWPIGLYDAIYYWEEDMDQYASYVFGVGTNGGTNFVPPTQAFFFEANGDETNIPLLFTNNEREHSAASFYYKDDPKNILKLRIESGKYSEETVIRFLEQATSEWDGHYDAKKLVSLREDVPVLYTKTGETKLSINSMPETEEVPIYLTSATSGNFSIEAVENDFDVVLLIDKKKGVVHDLISDYEFYYKTGENEDRFVIHFGDISTDSETNEFVIYSSLSNIVVYNVNNQQGDVYIFNVMGQQLKSNRLQDGINNITLDNARGYYIVNVRTDENVINKKVYIH